jgi:hypothetical protein
MQRYLKSIQAVIITVKVPPATTLSPAVSAQCSSPSEQKMRAAQGIRITVCLCLREPSPCSK